jgi:DNA-binding transcriptional ArsR family regulator
LAITRNPVKVLDVLSDPKAYQILERTYIANNDGVESHVIANHVNLSPSEFYRLALSLREQNMIEKKNQKYYITFFGRAVYKARKLLEKAIDNYHKLKVIDFLEEQGQIPESELNKIIEICIDDHQLKDILNARKNSSCNG